MINLGVHVSISGSIVNAPARARKLGCNTMQIFARNPRQWRKEPLSLAIVKDFRTAVRKAKISPVVIHIPYTLNLSAAKEKFYAITLREFVEDLQEADRLGAQYLVTHPGSHKGLSEEDGLRRVVGGLKNILRAVGPIKTTVLLENTAGAGQLLGANFAQLGNIIKGVGPARRIGICLDTAHAWSAGYAINRSRGLAEFIREIDVTVGLERVKVVHLNDTPVALGSRIDRHTHIGRGMIGRAGFKRIINHPAFKRAVFVMETPRESDRDDIRNINTVRGLIAR